MKDRQTDIDTWQATTLQTIDLLQATLLDLIDVNPPDRPASRRKPSRRDRSATDRADGRYLPTQRSSGRSEHTQVEAAVLRWERRVQAATTDLAALVSATVDIRPTGPDGQELVAPSEPPTRVTTLGVTVIDVHPTACRQHVVASCGWLQACVGQIASQAMRHNQADDGPYDTGRLALVAVLDRGRQLARDIATTARKHDAPLSRLCRCGCGLPAPEPGKGATRDSCRQRQSRERQTA